MLSASVERILRTLKPEDVVLDVGGWACPFNRAQYILDAESYETRGWYKVYGGPASQGGDKEWFSKDTWIQRDICEHTPWPFKDKEFDFAICSGTLEDIRDPLWVCSELMRVAKRGYIEVPTRQWESSRGIEYPNLAGMSHHRWLVEIEGDRIHFLQKYHAINAHWRFSFPRSYGRSLVGERAMQCLWWEGSFGFVETSISGTGNTEQILAEYIERIRPYPAWLIQADRFLRRCWGLPARALRKVRKKINYAKYGFAEPG